MSTTDELVSVLKRVKLSGVLHSLDLRIRELTGGERSLDDAMRALWRTTYKKDRGYTEDDVITCLSEAADAPLGEMVQAHVHGPLDPDFVAALAPFGLKLVEKVMVPAATIRRIFARSRDMFTSPYCSEGIIGSASREPLRR